MTVWLDRAGRHGEYEEIALEKGIAVTGSDKWPDMSVTRTREDIQKIITELAEPGTKENTIANWARQAYSFVHEWKEGDLVVLPLKTRSTIAIGKVTGPYKHVPENPPFTKHTRPVKWIKTDIPRTAFDQDILYSLGAALTVCKISRNNAEERIRAVLEGRKPPAPPIGPDPNGGEETEPTEPLDLEQYGRDQIQDFIGRKFKGHALERLVNEILKAQGYKTQAVPPGADGGVDIIAGQGPLGFDAPRLVVQVKSSESPIDVGVLRELQGVLQKFGAAQGLLVSWGGFKSSVDKEAKPLFFQIRLWDSNDLITALLKVYDNLSEDIQAELPLKRVWTLVQEE